MRVAARTVGNLLASYPWAAQCQRHGVCFLSPKGSVVIVSFFSNLLAPMSRSKSSFPPALLESLRALSVQQTLDRLGLYWKADVQFQPVKDSSTVRLHVSLPAGCTFELLATGPKWYDTRTSQGGGGAIDLTMHLFQLSFVQAVKKLTTQSTTTQSWQR